MFATIAPIVVLLLAQPPPTPPADGATPAARLAAMEESAAFYHFIRDAGPLRSQPEPAFLLGNQSNNVLEGAIFLWCDGVGRPEVVAQVFLFRTADKPEGIWLHEFASLSTGTYTGDKRNASVWTPATPGVAFKTLPGAAKPAATPAARLR